RPRRAAADRRGGMTAVLEASRLERRYGAGEASVAALRGVDIAVERGEFVAGVGAGGLRGGGGAQFARRPRPTHPPARGGWRGGPATAGPGGGGWAGRGGPGMGLVSHFFTLVPSLSVVDNVALPMRLVGRRRADAQRVAERLLLELGVADKRDSPPLLLSGGE